MLGLRFKYQLADAGLSPAEAAKLLHVTERTIRNWISGKVSVPYAAYKLVRVQRYFELPGDHWRGWHFAAGKLWSPEGHGFEPQDSNWWALLVRQARSFKNLYQRQAAFDVVLRGLGADRAAAPTASVARRSDARTEPQSGGTPGQREALSLDLSLGHFGTQRLEKPVLQRENRKTVGPSIKSASTNLDGVHDGR